MFIHCWTVSHELQLAMTKKLQSTKTNKKSPPISAHFAVTILACTVFAGADETRHSCWVASAGKACHDLGHGACPLQHPRVWMGQPPSSGTWGPLHLPEAPRVGLPISSQLRFRVSQRTQIRENTTAAEEVKGKCLYEWKNEWHMSLKAWGIPALL